MSTENMGSIETLVRGALGDAAADATLRALEIDAALLAQRGPVVSRAAFAVALNVVLFHDLLQRVPSGRRFVDETLARGERVVFDHGALRTIRFADDAPRVLPNGEDAFSRILVPLGYAVTGVYPLPRLRMTGRAYRHLDAPTDIPQFFLSELHVEQFDYEFATVANRVFVAARDPLTATARAVLSDFAKDCWVSTAAAAAALPVIARVFGRQHGAVAEADYRTLLAQSAEAGWIATEGNAFNHATSRVDDVDALAADLRAGGRPIKERVEVSASGRVRQTALLADPVSRDFLDDEGGTVSIVVPGSFYEFISRDVDPATGQLDLAFDSGNATGIFAMTRAA